MGRHQGDPRSQFETRVRQLMAAREPAIDTYAELSKQTGLAPAILQAMFRLEKRPTNNSGAVARTQQNS